MTKEDFRKRYPNGKGYKKSRIEAEKKQQKIVEEGDYFIVYVGVQPFRPDEIWVHRGMTFEKNVVYPVTEELFTYLKHIKGFKQILGVEKKKRDFPKVKKR